MADGDLARSHVTGGLMRCKDHGDLAHVKSRTYRRVTVVLTLDFSFFHDEQAAIAEAIAQMENRTGAKEGTIWLERPASDLSGKRWECTYYTVTDAGVEMPAPAGVANCAYSPRGDGVFAEINFMNSYLPITSRGTYATGARYPQTGDVTSVNGGPSSFVATGYMRTLCGGSNVNFTARITCVPLGQHPACSHVQPQNQEP